MSVSLYDPRRQRVLVSLGPGYATHLTNGWGKLLCAPASIGGMQSVLDSGPTCGWCRLIDGPERNTRLVDSQR